MTVAAPTLLDYGVLLAKTEADPGTDVSPVYTDAVYVHDVARAPSFNVLNINAVNGSRSPAAPKAGKLVDVWTIRRPLQGSGALGTEGEDAPLWRACGWTVTATPATSVVKTPVPTKSTCTMYYYDGVRLHKLTGAAGTLNFELVGQVPMVVFTMSGKYGTVTAATLADDPTYDSVTAPSGTAPTVTLDSADISLRECTITTGAEVGERPRGGGVLSYVAGGRWNPTMSLKIEDSPLGTKNWRAAAFTPVAFSINFAGGVGNDITIAATDVVLGQHTDEIGDGGIAVISFGSAQLVDSAARAADFLTITEVSS